MTFSLPKSTHGKIYSQSINPCETKENQVVRASGCLHGRRAEYLADGLLFLIGVSITIVPLSVGIFLGQGCTRDNPNVPFSTAQCQLADFITPVGFMTTLLTSIAGLFHCLMQLDLNSNPKHLN